MQVNKIKKIKEEVQVVLSKTVNGVAFHGDVKAEPEPGFLKDIDALKPSVLEMCELSKKSEISISGISFSYHGEMETQAAIITFQKKLLNGSSVITINTPLRYVERTGENTPTSQIMSETMAKLIEKITGDAKKFIQGLRKQTELFQ